MAACRIVHDSGVGLEVESGVEEEGEVEIFDDSSLFRKDRPFTVYHLED